MSDAPAIDAYFADPFVLRLPDATYIAYGSADPAGQGHAQLIVEAYNSADLLEWKSVGPVLERGEPALGDAYWAPEVIQDNGAYWMYYSVGHGIRGHHLRVARSESPWGPFHDLGLNLTPNESFAIDPHPFRAEDGTLYLYFARDVLESERPGTHLAVMPMRSPTGPADPPSVVLAPNADWQIYARQRRIYDSVYDWHTLEGPSVVYRRGKYWMTYSGGAWTGPDYAVSWASAGSPLGPWTPAPTADGRLLQSTAGGLIGPGHNSLTRDFEGKDIIAFHSWDEGAAMRRMHLNFISFEPDGPRVGGPIRDPFSPQEPSGSTLLSRCIDC